MKVKDYLKGITPEQFHIFDSHQEMMGQQGMSHQDRDYQVYSYNIHKNNKPKEGDVFLYRRPGKSTATRKFNIYGGGVIASIEVKDGNGNVEAFIEKPFKLITPLVQGDPAIDDFGWTSKKKEKDSWGHFWNQYGMNVINEHDFYGLVGELECAVPGDVNPFNAYPIEAYEELDSTDELDSKGFKIDFAEDGDRIATPAQKETHEITGKHIDYTALHHTKQTIGKAGELLVLEMLSEQLEGTGAIVEHTSVEKGDGYGYDIRILYKDGAETQIEVKTTKARYIDGFYITPSELNASRKCKPEEKKRYQIYRVYNYNSKSKTASIKIFDAPFNDEMFRFEPVSWKVHLR